MTAFTNKELLRLCDEVLFTEPKGDETFGEIKDICTLARALKSRVQAEAQAPALVYALTEDERATIEQSKLYGRAGATSGQLMCELLAIIDRLTV